MFKRKTQKSIIILFSPLLIILYFSIFNEAKATDNRELFACGGQALVCNNQVNAAIDAGCVGYISIDGLLESPCYGSGVQYSLEVKLDKNETYTYQVNAGNSGSLSEGFSIVPEHITCNKTYTVKVSRSENGGSRQTCSTRIKFEDGTPPNIQLVNQTIVACEGISEEVLKEQIQFYVSDYCPSTTTKVSLGHFPSNFCNGNASVPVIVEAVDFCGNVAKGYFDVRVTRPTQVVLPRDTTLTCGSGSDPLVTGYPSLDANGDGKGDIPIIETTCSFASTFTDTYFPSCANGQKIYRTWLVYDWCSSTSPINTYQQFIYIKDTEAPKISCPAYNELGTKNNPKLILANSSDCSAQIQNILPTAKDNCDGEVSNTIYKIVNQNSPYSTYSVHSTDLLEGKYSIEYAARDACGNLSARCTYYFNVQQGGTPIALCKDQLNVSLSGNHARIRAQDIDAGSYDECGSISLAIKKEGGNWSNSIDYSCEESANQTKVYLRVVNDGGASNTCWISINAGHGGGPCASSSSQEEKKEEDKEEIVVTEETTNTSATEGNTPTYNESITSQLQGKIKTVDNKPVPQVAVEAINNFGFVEEGMTDEAGNFTINLPNNANYQFSFGKEDQLSNGVSIIDMVIILRHILGITEFQTPYQNIAADINDSGQITTLDVVELRKMILGIGSLNNASWRFVEETGNTSINITLQAEDAALDLIAIKIGDLNNTASTDGLLSSEVRNNLISNLQTKNQWIQKGELITVPFYLPNLEGLQGVQFALNTSSMKILSVQTDVLADQQWNLLNDREIAIAWDYLSGKEETQPLFFELTLKAEKTGFLENFLSISETRVSPLAYSSAEKTSSVILDFEDVSNTAPNTNLNSFPNPFTDETTISFNLSQAEEVSLTLLDINGALLNQFHIKGRKGVNTFSLSKEDITSSGMIFYHLKTEEGVFLNKMIKI